MGGYLCLNQSALRLVCILGSVAQGAILGPKWRDLQPSLAGVLSFMQPERAGFPALKKPPLGAANKA